MMMTKFKIIQKMMTYNYSVVHLLKKKDGNNLLQAKLKHILK